MRRMDNRVQNEPIGAEVLGDMLNISNDGQNAKLLNDSYDNIGNQMNNTLPDQANKKPPGFRKRNGNSGEGESMNGDSGEGEHSLEREESKDLSQNLRGEYMLTVSDVIEFENNGKDPQEPSPFKNDEVKEYPEMVKLKPKRKPKKLKIKRFIDFRMIISAYPGNFKEIELVYNPHEDNKEPVDILDSDHLVEHDPYDCDECEKDKDGWLPPYQTEDMKKHEKEHELSQCKKHDYDVKAKKKLRKDSKHIKRIKPYPTPIEQKIVIGLRAAVTQYKNLKEVCDDKIKRLKKKPKGWKSQEEKENKQMEKRDHNVKDNTKNKNNNDGDNFYKINNDDSND